MKITLFLIVCILATIFAQQQTNPTVKYDKFANYKTRPTRPATTHKDVKNKDGNPPFVFIGIDPKLPEKRVVRQTPPTTPSSGKPTTDCVQCPCVPRKVPVEVECPKEIHRIKYVPYYLYYSTHAVITGDRAAYLSKLIYKIRILRKTNAHFRLVLKQLVLKQKINKDVYQKADLIALRKKRELDRAIVTRKISIQKIESEILKLKAVMKKLGYEVSKPTVCKTILGKRVCGLREGKYSKKKGGRVYKLNRLFTKVYFYLRRPKIISLSKKKDYVVAVSRGKQWVRKTVKVNQKLRTNIVNIAYAQQYRFKNIFDYIQKTLKKMRQSKKKTLSKFLKTASGRRLLTRRIIQNRFGKRFRKTIRSILNSKVVKDLQKSQYKPVVKTTVYPTKVTKIAVKLPKAVMNLESKDLIKLLQLKARSKK